MEAQNRMLSGRQPQPKKTSHPSSLKDYKVSVIKKLKEAGYSEEQYSFRYAYFKGLPIWKIIPHVRKSDGRSERYNIEILDGLTVKIGNPF